MFKFVVTIEWKDGTTSKKEFFGLPDAVHWLQTQTAGKGDKIGEMVIRSKLWI